MIVAPDLVNLIHINFLQDANIPWIAEADFLLSPLCESIGNGLYQIAPIMRDVLLMELRGFVDNVALRQESLADFLIAYCDHPHGHVPRPEVLRAHRWIARAYRQPQRVVDEMVAVLTAESAAGMGDVPASTRMAHQLEVATLLEVVRNPLERGIPAAARTKLDQLLQTSEVIAHYWYRDRLSLAHLTVEEQDNPVLAAVAHGLSTVPKKVTAQRPALDLEDVIRDDLRTLADPVVSRPPAASVPDPESTSFADLRFAGSELPFVGRVSLRSALQGIASEYGVAVLIVNGPPGSGKSYTYRLIQLLEQSTGSFRTVYFDFDAAASASLDPDDIVRQIAVMAAWGDLIPNQGEPSARRTARLVDWMRGKLGQMDRALWIVFDGADNPSLPVATHRFIARLADLAETDTSQVRLVLLGYSKPLPPRVRGYEVYLEPLSKEDIYEFLIQWANMRGVQVEDERVIEVTEYIVSQLEQDQGRLNRLPGLLRNVMEGLGGPREATVNGENELAIADYTMAIELDPKDAAAYNNRGNAYYSNGELDLAITDYTQAIELNPQYAFAYNNRGKAYKDQGELELAIADYTKAIELNPQYALIYNNRGIAYSDKGEVELAFADFAKAIELNPEYADVYYNRGKAYKDQGELELAIADCTKAIELKPQDAEAYNNRGIAYSDKGEVELAIADYTKAIELNPQYAFAYNNRGIAYSDKGELELAFADFAKAIELKPQDADVYYNRGKAYKDQGELELAIADCTKAIELDPKDAEAYNNRGNAYKDQGELELAIADYTQAIELNPQYAEAYNNRGKAYKDQGELELAIADYTKAIGLNPQYALIYNNRGSAYSDKGEVELAIADYTKAIELNPQYAFAYNNRGIAYSDKGEVELAIADYTKAIELNPQYAFAYNNRGIAYSDKGELELAIVDYTQAINLNPNDVDYYYNRGIAFKDQGELELAIADYTQAIELNPNNGDYYYDRGNAYKAQGKHDLAKADHAKARELGVR